MYFDFSFPAAVLEHAPLEAVHIYFDTATYDEIERDEKVSFFNNIIFITFSCYGNAR